MGWCVEVILCHMPKAVTNACIVGCGLIPYEVVIS